MQLAAKLKADKKNGKEEQKLVGKNIALIFEKDSTRTNEVVAVSKLGEIEYREIPMEVKPEVRVEGGQHLNVNVLRRETL
ncbi:hypothetical protein MJO10_29255, partial [Salmonella enterica subsp. enterica serovar Anatum]|nr:hypothetical protein [Salmonella enterica subsp. enterica serovar Anatum]